MKFIKVFPAFITLPFALLFSVNTNAATITTTLGNDTGLTDGGVYSLIPTILSTQTGQPAPFDQGYGQELLEDPTALNWLFSYTAFTETVVSATLTFGVFDIDTASPGSQLDAFSVNSTDLTSLLDGLFESKDSGDNVYNEFTISLSSTFFAALQTGLFDVSLDVGGSGSQTDIFSGTTSSTPSNGFHLLFSTLEITTRDTGGTDPSTSVPEPSTVALFTLALIGMFRQTWLRK
jgi:hypothetical protein